MKKYTIGVDFGSLSGRAVLVDVENGEELAASVYEYPHAVMDKTLPTGEKLGNDWALQNPMDYVNVLLHTIPKVIGESGVSPEDIIGVGTDFTACTVLPILEDGTPLCFLEEYKHNPHAYVKLWKHHAAQGQANRLNQIAKETNQAWLKNYGGKISSEWAIPKLMQIAEEAPDIYDKMDRFIEAADWIVWVLTGMESHNSCTAGYKAIYTKGEGYPDNEFFKQLNPKFDGVIGTKLSTNITPLGSKAGGISKKMAELTGLKEGTAVCVGNVDAHVCVPAVSIHKTGAMLAIMGTSTCHILLGDEKHDVPGMCGVAEDGVYPGYFGYEAGQSCVGDHFAWFIANCVPAAYYEEAGQNSLNIHEFLQKKAEQYAPGESGLLALDWWNGNRSVLVDVDLTGMILGMTLQTKPEEMYRALIEATAYGTREIVENFRRNGVPVNEFYASGGISQKNAMMMQIYADVLNMPIRIAGSLQGPALGSAIFASLAAGKEAGGYDNIFDAAQKMGKIKDKIYEPIAENVEIYDSLFAEYKKLHDYFGRGENDVMKHLKQIKERKKGESKNA